MRAFLAVAECTQLCLQHSESALPGARPRAEGEKLIMMAVTLKHMLSSLSAAVHFLQTRFQRQHEQLPSPHLQTSALHCRAFVRAVARPPGGTCMDTHCLQGMHGVSPQAAGQTPAAHWFTLPGAGVLVDLLARSPACSLTRSLALPGGTLACRLRCETHRR